MSDGGTYTTTRKNPTPSSPDAKSDTNDAEAGNEQVQKVIDEETARGYRGFVPDPTPNENYTVAGVVSNKPTPETNLDLRREARAVVAE